MSEQEHDNRRRGDSTSADSAGGAIEVIRGCMFSGKTARLIEELNAARAAGLTVIAFKHASDKRYAPTELATHDGQRFPAHSVSDAETILAASGVADVIGVDEGQFFGTPLVGACERLRAAGRRVIVAGIDYNVWGKPFEPMPDLKAVADRVVTLRIPCTVCGKPAPFTQRMVPVVDGQWVGGLSEYEPRCENCFVPSDEEHDQANHDA